MEEQSIIETISSLITQTPNHFSEDLNPKYNGEYEVFLWDHFLSILSELEFQVKDNKDHAITVAVTFFNTIVLFEDAIISTLQALDVSKYQKTQHYIDSACFGVQLFGNINSEMARKNYFEVLKIRRNIYQNLFMAYEEIRKA